MFIKLNKKGQNTLEYVLLVTSVVVAFLAIQFYLNRGLQGRVREASDNIGSQFDAEATESEYTTTRVSTQRDVTQIDAGGGVYTESTLLTNELTTQIGDATVQTPVAP